MTINGRILDLLLDFETKQEQKAFLRGYECGIEEKCIDELPQAAPPQELTITLPLNNQRSRKSYRILHRGLRAQILRMLYTGGTGYDQLAKTVQVAGTPLTSMLSRLSANALVKETTTGLYFLTDKGKLEAKFFVDHPTVKTKNPHMLILRDVQNNNTERTK